ncbi:hypothetical protein DMN91_001495 [Ooceraea biroi]|uniref:Uncharacterized protein n=1 Tax=Ooceraea biroi TaxID=2015173 RepID=A0A3L8DZH9_OOCBI|nr:hypothetical protein DMN91_001495 [Ooceraea biroi]
MRQKVLPNIYSVITLENTMAEMATKKSINVVSNKKSEVCNVQSNNDLIDLDDLTASNNQLISLCDDDDLVLTKNTHNALDGDDKSLQELIDSELALRICSSKSGDKVVTDNEESEEIVTRPETIKRIILDHRQNLVDVNAKFITAENEHCSFIEESCAHQNSYVCPNANDAVIKSELMFSRDEEKKQVFIKQSEIGYSSIIIQKTSDENDQISSCSEPVNNNDINNSKDSNVDYQIGIKEIVLSTNDTSSDTCDFVDDELTIQQESFLASMICPKDKYQQEEKLTRNVLDDTNLSQININEEKKKDVIVRGEQVPFSDQQTHQSFDNLDKKFYQQHQSSDKQECNKELMNEHINKFDEFCGYSRMKEKEDEILISSISQSKFSLLEMTEKTQSKLKGKLKEDPHNVQSIQEQFKSCDNDINQCKMFMETTTSMQFSDTERHALGEEALQKTSQILSEIIESMTLKSNELTEYPKNIEKDTQNLINESLSNELSESDSSFLKKVEITVSDTNMICSDTKQIVEKLQNLDSWTTVEETTKLADTKKKQQQNIRKHDVNINEMKTDDNKKKQDFFALPSSHVPLATSDEMEISDVSNICDTENYVSETNRSDQQRLCREQIATGISIKQLVGQNGDANTNCRSCGKVVFQMEQTKAEGLVWHKNCFRCVQCSKQLNVDNYESHESTLYSSDKPDLGLEELLSLNVKSRFEVFEKASTESTNEIEKSPSQIAVKRSPSILSKLAKSHHGEATEKRRRRSSSSTTNDERERRDERFERLERMVESLDQRSHMRSSCMQKGDEKMIPLFDPSKDDLVIERWIEHVDELVEQYGWNKQAALYGSVPGQALGDYCFQKLNKLRKLNVRIPDKYLIDAVIGGITDPIVARTVRAAQHADANALYAFMTELDNVVSKSAKSKVTTDHKRERVSSSSRREKSQTVNEEDTASASEVSDAKAKHAQIECFNCGKAGHIARKCRKPRVECDKCKRLGHCNDKCPFKKDVNTVEKSNHTTSMYVVTVHVNGHKVKGLIDTGSACTLLQASVVNKYNINVHTTAELVLKGFARQTVASNKTTSCEIRIMEAVACVKAVVMPDDLLIYDVVIGRDFLEQEHVVVIKKKNELLLKQVATVDEKIERTFEVNCVDVLTTEAMHMGNVDEDAKQKFQAKGMDIGVADESLNGIPYEESSESEDELKTEQTEECKREDSKEFVLRNTVETAASYYATEIIEKIKRSNSVEHVEIPAGFGRYIEVIASHNDIAMRYCDCCGRKRIVKEISLKQYYDEYSNYTGIPFNIHDFEVENCRIHNMVRCCKVCEQKTCKCSDQKEGVRSSRLCEDHAAEKGKRRWKRGREEGFRLEL